ncbi:MAG TPA: hypothetical protein O0X25_02515 [Methanocorpusculum sp.]|nr:hypothetical protein [Methanocorpusculum sp.]HJJ39990.1 hypothetical protein [Methanocorpusculum sp.]HJJ49473.1 hypothetical protein [Methanocorpusculum sp.]HJJ57025.1 hypothetical protein [Methanocorpusculum sp.]
MSDDDIDWMIYHLVPDGEEGVAIPELSAKTGLDTDTVLDSLIRLEDKHLVIVKGDCVFPLSISDFLFASQLKEATSGLEDLGIYIEDGIIKVKK